MKQGINAMPLCHVQSIISSNRAGTGFFFSLRTDLYSSNEKVINLQKHLPSPMLQYKMHSIYPWKDVAMKSVLLILTIIPFISL